MNCSKCGEPLNALHIVDGCPNRPSDEAGSMSEYTGLGPLPEGERMDAYYYSFTPTGVALIDSILSAVAVAGKGSHHTNTWGDPDDYHGYYDRLGFTDVSSPEDLIQRTADRAADAVLELLKGLDA